MSDTTARVPPQDLDAEESVLGAMMLSPGAVDAVSKVLGPEGSAFYRPSHATIYRAALALRGRGDPVDAITLVAELERRADLEDVGGRVRIHELAALVPAASNAGHYARIIQARAQHRELIRVGSELTNLGYAASGLNGHLPEELERARSAIAALDAEASAEASGDVLEGLKHRDVLTLEFPAERYLVDDLIPVGTVGTIAGVPETHKSFLAQAIATRCAAGEGEVLGRQVQQKARVGHVWQDDSTREEAERIKLFESVHATPTDATLWWFLNPGIALPGDLDRLRATVDRYQLELVILDSFYSVVHGVDLRDQAAEQTILLLKREIADATGCTVLIVDHMPWATDTNRSRLRGYGGVHKGAAIRFGIYIDADGKKLYAEARGNNIRGFTKTPAYWDAEALELRLVDVAKVDQNELDDRVIAYVLDHPGASSKEVEDGVTGSRSSIRKALERLSTPGDAQSLAAGPGRQPHGNYWYPANHAGLASPGDPQATLSDPSPDLSQGQGSPESPLPRRGATSDGDPLNEAEIERLAALAEDLPGSPRDVDLEAGGNAARERVAP